MYAKGKGSTVPSDAQAREKWVHEIHIMCQLAGELWNCLDYKLCSVVMCHTFNVHLSKKLVILMFVGCLGLI